MTRTHRFLVVVAGATALVVTLGCGALNQAKDLVDNVATLGDFADRLGKAQNLTYTAKYDVVGQGDDTTHVTLAQQPPQTVVRGKHGSYLVLDDGAYFCDVSEAEQTCTRSAGTDGSGLALAAGGTFVSPELALGLVLAASVAPGVTVTKSEKTIAGQKSLCANVSGIEAAGDTPAGEAVRDFAVCITDDGVLASFAGTLQNGESAKVEMTSYAAKADPKLFELPKGAKIIDAAGTPTG